MDTFLAILAYTVLSLLVILVAVFIGTMTNPAVMWIILLVYCALLWTVAINQIRENL